MDKAENVKKNIIKCGVLFPDNDFVVVNGQTKRIDKEKEIELPSDLEGYIIEIPYIENSES